MIGGVRTKTRRGVVHYISFKEKSLDMTVKFVTVETAAEVVLPAVQVRFPATVVQVAVVSWLIPYLLI